MKKLFPILTFILLVFTSCGGVDSNTLETSLADTYDGQVMKLLVEVGNKFSSCSMEYNSFLAEQGETPISDEELGEFQGCQVTLRYDVLENNSNGTNGAVTRVYSPECMETLTEQRMADVSINSDSEIAVTWINPNSAPTIGEREDLELALAQETCDDFISVLFSPSDTFE